MLQVLVVDEAAQALEFEVQNLKLFVFSFDLNRIAIAFRSRPP